MKKTIALLTMLLALSWGWTSLTAAEAPHKNHGSGTKPESKSMEKTSPDSTFEHTMIEKNIRAEFQIMSLSSMNMKDPNGATHHVMVKLFHDSMNHPIKNAVGKVKLIGPNEMEQTNLLKNYNGIFAANFTINNKGKYGVICLVKVDGEKHIFKFWYPHE
ncbi:MAG: hypothetical protein JRF62_13940 [Deltaproteobacteria bacterium]|nr:hypothetical protein [Deltaproteobacteria bacterium]MBW2598398.1 hypothetical protein [Deltaproteobacteria bacterium]MBW2640746.1 hypothetical protein [Deltaproteobacteria bacterium]MBW2680925.1 hypothetical protein [Deltaproteobacteria bacterium]